MTVYKTYCVLYISAKKIQCTSDFVEFLHAKIRFPNGCSFHARKFVCPAMDVEVLEEESEDFGGKRPPRRRRLHG